MTAELPHVLIAEDDSLARMSLEKTAKHFGCRVTAVRNGEEALSAYQGEEFDLVLSDLSMPRLSGHALAQAIRADDSIIPIVMTSADGEIHDVVELLRVGVNDYLQKPIRPGELMRSLRVALDRARHKMPSSRRPKSSVESTPVEETVQPPVSELSGGALEQSWAYTPQKVQVTVNLRDIVAQLRDDLASGAFVLPTPKPITGLWAQLQKDPNLSGDKVVRLLEKSPNIARRAIAMSNTSFFRGTRRVSNLKDAVIRLGNRTVVNEAQTLLHREYFETQHPALQELFAAQWNRTLFVAAMVRELTRLNRLGDPENAYLASLFQNVGEIILLRYIGNSMGSVPTLNEDDMGLIRRVCIEHRGSVGVALLRKWNFPEECIALASYQETSQTSLRVNRLLHLCDISKHLADEQGLESQLGAPIERSMAEAMQVLGLREDALRRSLDRALLLVGASTQ
jgi:DNA-binding response OmpR family regulator/HD-like signal output (HDOD) protein